MGLAKYLPRSAAAITLALTLAPLPAALAETHAEAAAPPTPEPLNPYITYGRQYSLLREELTRYRALAEGDGWRPLDAGKTLQADMSGPRVRQLRSLLMQYGDYALVDESGRAVADGFDAPLEQAVRRFQRRHGLKENGRVDERTRAHLNTPPAERMQTLAANLQRWQQMPKELGPRYIVINIPDFSLRLMDGGEERYRMRVIVGKSKHKTPQLVTRLTRVELNPVWRVPPNIALRELLPKGSANLRSNGYRLVNHRGHSVPFTRGNIVGVRRGKVSLQQKGGPGNALGRVKFVIPNRQAIFLHDTNSKHLFRRSERAFSHGCIRLEKPLEFARMMLAQQNKWDDERIERALNSPRTHGVSLSTPIPVYTAYWTAWVDEEGLLQFRPDIYRRDTALENARAGE